MFERIVSYLSSMQFAVILLLLIAVISGVGTFLDLGSEADEVQYVKTFGPIVMKIAEALDLHAGRMYSTRWFNFLLALLVANSLLCGVNWLPRTLNAMKFASPINSKEELLSLMPSASIKDFSKGIKLIEEKLLSKGFEVKTEEDFGKKYLTAEKHRAAHWGFFITHIGFIIIILGAVVGKMMSEKGMIIIEEGTMDNIVRLRSGADRPLPFYLALEDFKVEYYSDIEISSAGENKIVKKTVDAGDVLTSPDGKYKVAVENIFPDAVLNEDGKIIERSYDFRAPIMQVAVLEKEELKERIFLYPDAPPVTSRLTGLSLRYTIDPYNPPKDWISEIVVIKNNQPVGRKTVKVNHPLDFDGWRFYQSSYDQEAFRYTVLEAAKDPGVPIVYFGFILLLFGVSFIYFFTHRRVWAIEIIENGKSELHLAGWTYHSHRLTKEWFDEFIAECKMMNTK